MSMAMISLLLYGLRQAIEVIVMAIVHQPTDRVIIDNDNGESRRTIVCDRNIDNEQRSVLIGFNSFTGCDYTP